MPFPDVTFTPETDLKSLLDKLQRFFVSARPYWLRANTSVGPTGPQGPTGATGATGPAGPQGIPGPVLTGSIIGWTGYISDCPAGWVVCDGTNGTPDLTASFIS